VKEKKRVTGSVKKVETIKAKTEKRSKSDEGGGPKGTFLEKMKKNGDKKEKADKTSE